MINGPEDNRIHLPGPVLQQKCMHATMTLPHKSSLVTEHHPPSPTALICLLDNLPLTQAPPLQRLPFYEMGMTSIPAIAILRPTRCWGRKAFIAAFISFRLKGNGSRVSHVPLSAQCTVTRHALGCLKWELHDAPGSGIVSSIIMTWSLMMSLCSIKTRWTLPPDSTVQWGKGILNNNYKYCPKGVTINGVTRDAGSTVDEGPLGVLYPCVKEQVRLCWGTTLLGSTHGLHRDGMQLPP